MSRQYLCKTIAMASIFLPGLAHADSMLLGDAKQGEMLHKQACVACHTTTVYTRPNHTVKSIGGLVGRVNACSQQLQLNLPSEQINHIVKYLNDNYYKFDPEK